jgi:MFS family permease
LLISTGILVSYSADLAISLTGTAIPDDWKWRVMLGLSVVPALAQFLSLLALPDSPRWLVSTGRVAEAREILISLRGRGSESAVDEEIRVIQASLVATCTEEAPLFKESINYGTLDSIGRRWERWTKGVRDKLRLLNDAVVLRALFIAIFLQIGQQLSGINAVRLFKPICLFYGHFYHDLFIISYSSRNDNLLLQVVYYTPTILERVGVSSLFEHHIGRLSWITPTDAKHAASLLATDIVYVPKIPSIFLAMWLIDRRGRRQLFFAGLSLMIVALGLLVVTSADVIHKEAAQVSS